MMATMGESLMVVKDVLHHASIQTTQIYARLDQRAIRAALTRHAAQICAADPSMVTRISALGTLAAG